MLFMHMLLGHHVVKCTHPVVEPNSLITELITVPSTLTLINKLHGGRRKSCTRVDWRHQLGLLTWPSKIPDTLLKMGCIYILIWGVL